MVKETPSKGSKEKFWEGIWEEKKACNMCASWIRNMEIGNKKLKEKECENMTVLELKAALTKSLKRKSLGIDKVQNISLNTLSSSNVTFTTFLNEIIQNPEKTLKWMYEGAIYLLNKNTDTKDPKKSPPNTFLSTIYKFLTSVLTDRTYSHLEQNHLFPLEEKGYRHRSYGCKDQLMINKMILENCKKRKQNLTCLWIYYEIAFASVPHEWILRSLELFNVFPREDCFFKT